MANTPSCSGITSPKSQQRRHTSYHDPRPSFLSVEGVDHESAMIDEESSDEFVFGDTDMDIDRIEEQEDVAIDEHEEFEQLGEYGDSTNRMYKVHVTEITVNENDNSIFPN